MLGHQRVHQTVPIAAAFSHRQVNLFVDEHSEVTAIICVCRRGSKGMKMMKDFECEQGGSL